MKNELFVANELLERASFNSMMELLGRDSLVERIEQTVSVARKLGKLAAVLFVDIDRFNKINYTLGYAAGDAVLMHVATWLKVAVGTEGTVVRIGGGEFAVLLDGVSEISDLVWKLELIQSSFRTPLRIGSKEYHITAGIGAAADTGCYEDGRELLRRADVAKSLAKESGRNQWRIFQQGMFPPAADKMEMERDLYQALKNDEFVLHYQPKVSLASGHVCGVEALIRWNHPIRGRVSPMDFVPVLEDSGLIVPVGEWVIRAACEQAALWRGRGFDEIRIAINVSPWQFHDEGLLVNLKENLLRNALRPGLIEVEITESLLMKNPENAARIIREIRELGILVSIDDFGTGYSSLAYLKRFPVDFLKIDRAFVRELPHDKSDAAICRAVLQFASALGISVVAEGVETIEQAEFMLAHDCHELQGFLFSQPLPAEELECLLAEGRRLIV